MHTKQYSQSGKRCYGNVVSKVENECETSQFNAKRM